MSSTPSATRFKIIKNLRPESLLAAVLLVLVCGLASLVLGSGRALAWGERGHQLISRSAVHIMKQRNPSRPALWMPFRERSEMLAHLANIPDISWKSKPKGVTAELNPSHWFDMEYVSSSPNLHELRQNLDEQIALIKTNCPNTLLKEEAGCEGMDKKHLFSKIGSLPWRIGQFSELLRASLSDLKQSARERTLSRRDAEGKIHIALLYAGILGHFVGDASQPLHLTENHDGWRRNQGGLHAYFEDKLVDELSLDAEQKIVAYALSYEPAKKVVARALSAATKAAAKDEPLAPPAVDGAYRPVQWAFGLAMDSFERLDYLLALDEKNTLIKPSAVAGKTKTPAERKGATEALPTYNDLLIERLAIAADMLAYYWEAAWREAGEPDLSQYHSYLYHLDAEIVRPDYLDP